jgi:hypothetical protein
MDKISILNEKDKDALKEWRKRVIFIQKYFDIAKEIIDNLNKKTCSKCGITKELDEFNKDKTQKDNKSKICKTCINEYRRNHYKNNGEMYKKYKKHRNLYYKKMKEEKPELLKQRRKKHQKTYLNKRLKNKALKEMYDVYGDKYCHICEAKLGDDFIGFIKRMGNFKFIKNQKKWIPICQRCKARK